MTHVTDEVLAALALGDPDVDPADRQHAETCPLCSEEVAELASVHGLLREEAGMRGAHRVDPGPHVWQRILAATGDDVPAAQEPAAADGSTVEGPVEPVASGSSGPSDRPAVPSLAARRAGRQSRRSWWLAGTAAACLLIGVLVGRAVWAPGETSESVVATVPLTTLDASKQK